MVIIKRYPNRKLYNTEAKQYITLDGIADLIRGGVEVQVVDNANGEDLTALTLTQIILEQEKKQSGLLSNSVLTGLIRAGGDRISALQRSLSSSLSFWRQMDEEIKRRIHGLVQMGELTEREGRNLVEKMIQQGARLHEPADEAADPLAPENLEAILKERQVPTQEDLGRIYQQLEELTAKLEQVAASHSAEGE